MTRGRPREFDPDAALDQALALFVRDGFEKASVQELAERMGICKPSLYSAYGNKETLFIEALRRYSARGAEARAAILDGEPDGRRAVEALLQHTADHVACAESGGCLIVGEAATSPSHYSVAVREAVREALAEGAVQLRARLVRAQADGHLAAHADVDALTTYFGVVMSGMSVQARSGATAAEMGAVVRAAMGAWVG